MSANTSSFKDELPISGKTTQYDSNLPVFSIITVVWNCQNTIEKTIQSIIGQTYPNIEYIIIDGNSTDKTIDIIKQYKNHIALWISEPDKGIYDAMNKGIKLAQGNYINFMNAGDVFADDRILSKIADTGLLNAADVIFGDFIAVDEDSKMDRMIKAKPLSKLWKGAIASHQSVFVNSDIIKKNLFDTKLDIAADYKQLLTLQQQGYVFQYIPQVITKTSIDGISYSNPKTILEQFEVFRAMYPHSIRQIYFIKLLITSKIKRVLGTKILKMLRKIKWKLYAMFQK